MGSQFWEAYEVELTELGELLERLSTFQPKSLGYYKLKKHKPFIDKGY
jgi:hypothetical protein